MHNLKREKKLYQLKSVKIRSHRVAGFALPTAIFLGMIAILIALTTIVRSQSSQSTAKGLQHKIQAGFVSDAGVSQVLASFKDSRYEVLLARNYDPIDPVTSKTYLGGDGIPLSGDESAAALDEWGSEPLLQPNPCESTTVAQHGSAGVHWHTDDLKPAKQLDQTNQSLGEFELLAYRFRDPNGSYSPATGLGADGDEVGYALIQGDRPNSGKARRWVSFPIAEVSNTGKHPFPGVFAANSINLGNKNVEAVPGEIGANANVICANCNFSPTGTTNGNPNCSSGLPTFPTSDALNAAVNRTGNVVGQVAIIPTARLKPIPVLPTTVCPPNSSSNCYIDLGVLDETITLPRPTDPPSGKLTYKISKIDLLPSEEVTVNTTGREIDFYVTNPTPEAVINMEAAIIKNIRINNSVTPPQQVPGQASSFYIYSDANANQPLQILDGSRIDNAIIYAPNATLQLEGLGTLIAGAVWVRDIAASTANNIEIQVPDSIPNQINPLIDSLTAWQVRPIKLWNQQPVD